MMILSKRLQKIADCIPRDSRLADIGSDHAMLPVYAVARGMVSYAVAGELNEGPFQAARQQVQVAGLESKVSVRRGDGLAVLTEDEVDVVTVAGMGGSLIARILAAGQTSLRSVNRLILQPNVGEEFVRRWLHESCEWLLTEEHILAEDGRLYEILVADRCPVGEWMSQQLYSNCPDSIRDVLCVGPDSSVLVETWLMRMGPYLLRAGESLLIDKWRGESHKWRRMVRQMANGQHPATVAKRAGLEQEIELLEAILRCLPMVKRSLP